MRLDTARMTARKLDTKPALPTKKATSKAATKKQAGTAAPADWERIELDYRAGIKTLRQIADEHGITEGAVRKRAKRDDWTRDLNSRIQEKAEALVRKESVRSEVRKELTVSERQIVEANAQAVANVRLGQRKDIQRARSITMALLDELEQQAGAENAELLSQMGDLMRSPDSNGQDKLNDLYQKIISLPGRAKTMKDLGESLRVLVTLERQAFGMDAKDGDGGDAPAWAAREMTDTERAVRLVAALKGANGAAVRAALFSLGAGP